MNKGGKTKAAYDKAYESTPDQKKKRAARNKARRELMAEGIVHKGDGKDVDHKRMLDSGGSNDRKNLRAVSASENRGWRKNHGKNYG